VQVILVVLEPTVEHHPLGLPRLFQRILATVYDDVANDLDVSDTFWVVVCQGCLWVLPQLHHLCLFVAAANSDATENVCNALLQEHAKCRVWGRNS
jgi:hypothetical protein